MTTSGQGTHVSARATAPATHAHRPAPAPAAPVRRADHQGARGAEGVVGRLEEVRARLRAMLPLVHDEGGRQLAAALREVDAVLAELGSGTAHGTSGPGTAAPAPRPGGHRPPPLPCGPDYVLLPSRQGA